MKPTITLFLCLLSIVCQAQETYNVSWNIPEGTSSISVPSRPDHTFNPKEVPPKAPVTLTIEIDNNDFKELKYAQKKQNGPDEIKTLGQADVKFIENDKALEIEIESVGTTDSKMQIKGVAGELAYPYHFTIIDNKGVSYELMLGDNALLEQSLVNLLQLYQINVLEGILINAPKNMATPEYCNNMECSNVLIVIDASAGPSAKSRLYRKSKNGDCKLDCKGGIKVGDYVKIYLENFNPYRHTASVTTQEVDAAFGAALDLFPTGKSEPENAGGIESASTSSSEKKNKILMYAEAVRQLQVYVESMKNNSQPDSRVLEANKLIILNNLSKLKLTGDDIEEIYQALKEENEEPLEESYKIARLFNQVKTELLMMTYTLEATILPVKIRSFDKFEFTVTVKDKTTGKESFSRTYEYLIKGGLKLDQSFGVVFHGIRDQEFGLRSFTGRDTAFVRILNPDGTSRDSITSITDAPKREIIEEDSPGNITLGASTLTHLYWRTCIGNRIRVGIGPEVGISADIYPVTNIRYLFGLGVLFYDGRHRLSLDVGCALGKYQAFGNGQGFGTTLSGADAQPTLIDRNGRSFYCGISFNTPLVRNDTQKP